MLTHYDRSGKPISLEEWSELFERDFSYRCVAQHYVRGWKVSTIWDGIDFSFGYSPYPLIFETMIFPPNDETFPDEYCERYPTEEAAQAGHDRALAWIVDKIGDDSAAMDVISAEQFTDEATAPDDLRGLT